MIRKLIVVCFAAIAVMAMASASASAQHGVTVAVPGVYEAESTIDIRLERHTLGMETIALSCDNHWDVTIDGAGEGTINAEGIFPIAGDSGQCETAEPCNNHALWPLEVEENTEIGQPEVEAHTTFCLENTGNALINNQSANVECDYDIVNNEAHCDEDVTLGTNLFEVTGEVVVHGDPGISHG